MQIINKAIRFFHLSIFEKNYIVRSVVAALQSKYLYSHYFAKFGNNSWIKSPEMIVSPDQIYIGNNVRIERGVTLYCVKKYAKDIYSGKIVIGDRVYANIGLNISAAGLIEVGDDVAFGSNVFLNDFNHNYEDVNSGVVNSKLNVGQPIKIGNRSWIGANVYISGGVSLGEHCIVGANSVVTKSFPPNSVVAGVPAKIIKRYDEALDTWLKV
jgi:acetyltransferase-like isoleucine patch superfamily enzyme